MKRWLLSAVSLLLLSIALGASASAPDVAYEAAASAELDAKNVDAGKLFREANALRSTNPNRASQLYTEVLARVPEFDHALRRKCSVDVRVGNPAEALALCRRALAIRRTPENLAGLAMAMVSSGPEAQKQHQTEAFSLIDEAVRLAPGKDWVHGARCQVASAYADWKRMRESFTELEKLAPHDWETQTFGAILALGEDRLTEAGDFLTRAEAAGAPAEVVAQLHRARARAEQRNNPVARVLRFFVQVTIAWAIGLALLALSGWIVSRLTLRALSTGANAMPVRALYRGIVWLGAAYYYVSLPLVAVFVVGAAGGVTLLFLALGWIPIKLLVIVAALAIASIGATLKSVFQRVRDEPPGLALADDQHLRLHAVLSQVAHKVGTHELDEVRLTVGTDLAVTERGKRFWGEGRRTLVLGVGLLDGLRVRELKSLLAHEFGHFRNEDTAGGGLALRVRRGILLMALHLAQSGAAAWWNPAWLFVVGYHNLYLRITQGASRLQEVLADRSAVNAYGSSAFRRGLRHVIKRSVQFDAHLEHSVSDAVDARIGWANLYAHEPTKPVDDDALDEKYREAVDNPASPYDSHPSPRERLETAKAMNADGEPMAEADEAEAWSLFDDREALELMMTGEVRDLLLAQGVNVPKAA